MTNPLITEHAAARIAQRGIQHEALDVVLTYGEDAPAREGCVTRELRFSRVNEVLADGVPWQVIETALKIEAIVSRDEHLVTCYCRSLRSLARPPRGARSRKRYGRRV